MIIQRTEKDGIINVVYKSSNVMLSEYNKGTKDLNITFAGGGVYSYHHVPLKDYTTFELGDSQGKLLNTLIKKFPFDKIGTVTPDSVKTKINEAIEAEKESFRVRLVEIAKLIGENGLSDDLLKQFDDTRAYLNKI